MNSPSSPEQDRQPFRFLDPGRLIDRDLTLVLAHRRQGQPWLGYVPAYEFQMRHSETGRVMGRISLRVGWSQYILLYAGHIGYGVDPAYRGNHYAARSTMLLFPLARAHGINPMWVTCNPDNTASRRTLELAGGKFVEIVDLPKDCDMYRQGERQKCRYRFDL